VELLNSNDVRGTKRTKKEKKPVGIDRSPEGHSGEDYAVH
jgi:hypothetical protein